jgi:alkylhydroperoxidase/carboxymuconolactone decarboxylase family protein YurZ
VDETTAVLPLLPWTLAVVSTVLVVALSVPPGGPREATTTSGPSPVARRGVAALAAVLAVLVLVVARAGPAGQLDNPAPALVVGLGWPLLLLAPALVGLVRRRPDEASAAPRENAWPALTAALAVVGFLVLPVTPTAPSAVGTAVAAYALAIVAASVAVGRHAAAQRLEVLGLLARWAALGRALPRWAAPRGALAVLAVVLGGAWAERYERSSRWIEALPSRTDSLLALAIAVALAGAGAALLHLATRRGGGTGAAAAVLLPLALATAVAGAARRALISAQLLLDQVAGPRPLDPDPLGVTGGQLLSLSLVLLGGGLSAAVLARRMGEETARLPGVAVLLALTGVSSAVVLQA